MSVATRLAGVVASVVIALGLAAGGSGCSGCSGCNKKDDPSSPPAPSAAPSSRSVVAESLPRCRAEGRRLAIPGEDVVVGDAVLLPDAILVGIVRREGARRVAGVLRASLDFASSSVVDLGQAVGEDPPPSPRVAAGAAFVASFARASGVASVASVAVKSDAGAPPPGAPGTRWLEITRLEATAAGKREGAVLQQADESLAYDIAWPMSAAGAPLVAWDEDALPSSPTAPVDHGVVKVQLLGDDRKPRVASPETSDAESPRLLAKAGGYWLAWLARRPEPSETPGSSGAPKVEDAASPAEGPGERRAFGWVELVSLDAKGGATSPVRRVSPATGRVASFDLAPVPGGDAQLVIIVQDDAAHAEGAGSRIVRFAITGDHVDGAELVDGGVGHALSDLLLPSGGAEGARWLAWTDTAERAHVVPLGATLLPSGPATLEPALDGLRVLAAIAPDEVVGVTGIGGSDAAGGRVELRRLVCR